MTHYPLNFAVATRFGLAIVRSENFLLPRCSVKAYHPILQWMRFPANQACWYSPSIYHSFLPTIKGSNRGDSHDDASNEESNPKCLPCAHALAALKVPHNSKNQSAVLELLDSLVSSEAQPSKDWSESIKQLQAIEQQ